MGGSMNSGDLKGNDELLLEPGNGQRATIRGGEKGAS